MNFTKKIAFVVLGLMANVVSAQDDLLQELNSDSPQKKEVATAAFKALQIGNMQSTKLAAKGEFYVIISHRFGDLSNGLDNFFGLDQAYTKIGGLYGVTNWLTIGGTRQTYNKIYELTAKYKLFNQEVNGFPVTIVGYNTMDINSALEKADYPNMKFENRLAYTTQLLISRKFNNSFSLEANFISVNKNLIERSEENKRQFLIGMGGRCKLTKRLSLNLEYANRFNTVENDIYKNPLTVGLDIETGGHVFQLVFSNSQTMNDVAYFTNTSGEWFKKGIYFGFNMYRVF